MGRIIVSKEELNRIAGEAFMEQSKEGVKEGSPADEILNLNDENSLFSKYLKKKKEEYNLAMENFEEDLPEKLEKARRRLHGEDEKDDEDMEEVVIGGGTGKYTQDDLEEIHEHDNVIEVDFRRDNVNPDNVIDDLL